MKEQDVVGHVPYNLAPFLSSFLQREVNKGTVRITGKRVNRGGGYGLEIPCLYCLYGAKPFIDKMKEIVRNLLEETVKHRRYIRKAQFII